MRIAGICVLVLTSGCGDFRDCTEEDVSAAAGLPERLSEAGLYADTPDKQLADGVIAFAPRFPLWTDGTDKERWLLLPEGGQVDTSEGDAWVFPVGTRLFKQFARDGERLETRLVEKQAGGWTAVTYVWEADESEALRQLDAVPDVAGTTHDVPSAAECLACHGGRATFALGFSATQLAPAVRTELFEAGVLSHAVDAELDLPEEAVAGLGVLHGNCGHCHNAERDEQPLATECYAPPGDADFDLSLPADLSAVDQAPAVLTARRRLGDGGGSDIVRRMSRREPDGRNSSMPPLGTEIVDEDGVRAVEAFIATLPAVEGR